MVSIYGVNFAISIVKIVFIIPKMFSVILTRTCSSNSIQATNNILIKVSFKHLQYTCTRANVRYVFCMHLNMEPL